MKKRVIITRDRIKAAALMAELKEHEVESFAVPVTRIELAGDATVPGNIEDYHIIVFTSANAVSAFADLLNSGGDTLLPSIKLAAVGEITAAAVEEAFGRIDIVPEESNASALANNILKISDNPCELKALWPCAKNALPDLENELKDAGVDITSWICYETVRIEGKSIKSELQSLAPWDLVFFAAPSAVEAFSEAWEDRTGFIAAAIGPTTERALRKRGYSNIAVSRGKSAAHCAGTIVDALGLKVWS
jgi:uroporphyrinogen-III synthase